MGRRSVNTLVAWGLDFLLWFPKDLAIRPVREWVGEWSLTELPFCKLLRHGRSGSDVRVCGGNGASVGLVHNDQYVNEALCRFQGKGELQFGY